MQAEDISHNTVNGSVKLDKRGQVVREILETERKHVQDIEVLQVSQRHGSVSRKRTHDGLPELQTAVDPKRHHLSGYDTFYISQPR